FAGRKKSIGALEEVMRSDTFVMLATQKNASDDDPATEAIYEVGTLASVMQLLKLPDGTVKVLFEGAQRAKVVKYTDCSEYYQAEAVALGDTMGERVEAMALARAVEDCRHRKPADGEPGRAGQGRQGPLRHALSAAPENSTHLLAARSSEAMAVSRPRRRAAARTQRLARCLPFSLRGGGLEQAGDGAHLATHIRDPSLGERGG